MCSTCREWAGRHLDVCVVVGAGKRVSVELLQAAAVPVVGAVQIHADVLYEPRVSDGRVTATRRRHVAHSAAVGRRSAAAVARKPLRVGAERQCPVEATVVTRVAHRHDASLAVARACGVDEHNVRRTPPGAHSQLQPDVAECTVVAVRQYLERRHGVVVQQSGLDPPSTLVDRRPVHRRPTNSCPDRPIPPDADVDRVPTTVAVGDCRWTGVQLTPSHLVYVIRPVAVVAPPLCQSNQQLTHRHPRVYRN